MQKCVQSAKPHLKMDQELINIGQVVSTTTASTEIQLAMDGNLAKNEHAISGGRPQKGV